MGTAIVVAACLMALAAAGCGTGERADDAAAVAEHFHAALADDDGQAACEELSEETASKLEQDEMKPCEDAILELDLPKGGTVASRRVEMRSASTDLAQDGTDFLDEGPTGWKISAAGCRSTAPEQPYECVLED